MVIETAETCLYLLGKIHSQGRWSTSASRTFPYLQHTRYRPEVIEIYVKARAGRTKECAERE